MTLARRNASPVASGIAGAVSPGVQAAVAGSSPAQFRPSNNDCVEPVNRCGGDKGSKRATPGETTARYGWSRCEPGAQSPNSDFALGGVDGDTHGRSGRPLTTLPNRAVRWGQAMTHLDGEVSSCLALGGVGSAAKSRDAVLLATRPDEGSRFDSGPSAPFNDCEGAGTRCIAAPASKSQDLCPSAGMSSRLATGPQSPICPELTAYITTLLSVIGAVAWAHVVSMWPM